MLEIPKRSPDLSLCDYYLWPQVNRAMRKQEQNWGKKKETRPQYLKRLEKAARSLPKKELLGAISTMKKRCNRLYKAKGGLFEEGK